MNDRINIALLTEGGGSFLEETIECRAWIRRGTLSCARSEHVRPKEIAEICLLAIGDPLSLRLTALVVRMRIVVVAIQTAVDVGRAIRALVCPRYESFDL